MKEFNYFTNRKREVGLSEEPLDKMLTILDDEEWRNDRVAITPAFSRGKLRKITHDISKWVLNLASNLEKVAHNHRFSE